MKKIFFLTLAFGLLLCDGLFAQKEKNTAVLGFYNLENLFDTEDDPLTRDADFLPEGSYRWTPERYMRKLDNMSKVISLIGREYGGVACIGLCELENRKVLEDLIATDNLRPFNMDIVHYDSPDRRGVDVGFIYRKDRVQVLSSKSFRLYTADTSFRTRDQLLVSFILDGTDTMHMIVNHWPSKLGGKKSLGSRAAAAKLARSIADSLMNADPNAKIVIVGDFNDDPDSKSIITNLKIKKKIEATTQPGDLFNPMYKLYMDGIWSYVYRDEPNVIDQIIISYGLLNATKGFKYSSARIFRASFLLTKSGSYEGIPLRTFAGGNYLGGYSDHLPVYLILDLIK